MIISCNYSFTFWEKVEIKDTSILGEVMDILKRIFGHFLITYYSFGNAFISSNLMFFSSIAIFLTSGFDDAVDNIELKYTFTDHLS